MIRARTHRVVIQATTGVHILNILNLIGTKMKYNVVFDSILIRRYSYTVDADTPEQASDSAILMFEWGQLSVAEPHHPKHDICHTMQIQEIKPL